MKNLRVAVFVAVLAAPMCCSLTALADLYELELHLHSEVASPDMFDSAGNPVSEAPAGSALLPVVSETEVTRPSGSSWDFTGTSSGSNLWVLQKAGGNGLYLGIGAEEISSSDLDGPITLTFQSMSGPSGGVFSMWNSGVAWSDLSTALVTSALGFNLSNTLTIAAGGHTHFNYGFTTPGLYDVTFEATATLAEALGGGQVAGTGTFRFGVFDTGSSYPEPNPMQGPYVFFGNTFDNYIYGDGHVDLGVALTPVPEPSSIALAGLGIGSVAFAALRRRMRKR